MKSLTFLASALALAFASARAAEPFVIARRGADACCGIVIPTNSGECVRYAASELQKYTKRMTGVEMPVINEGSLASPPPRAVYLDFDNSTRSTRLKDLDAFKLCVSNGNLRVVGGGQSGVLYGVYELLERFGGCGWFAPWCETVPERESFEVPGDLDFSDAPAFDQRTASWLHTIEKNTAGGGAFSAKMRFKHTNGTKAKFGGPGVRYARGLAWDNGIKAFVSPEKHFEEHPEWFCEIGGVRRGAWPWQVCYTAPGLAEFVTERVKGILRASPGAEAISIAQNDCENSCQCAVCKAVNAEEGSSGGAALRFANAVAEEVEKEFPGVMVVTFAYQWSRFAPRVTKPRDNVMVVLCSFECSLSAPFAESSHLNTKRFVADLLAWGRICRNLRIYDYCTNFRNYLYPFPDLMALAPNYRLFRDNGLRWLGSQGGYVHADMAELKCYVQSCGTPTSPSCHLLTVSAKATTARRPRRCGNTSASSTRPSESRSTTARTPMNARPSAASMPRTSHGSTTPSAPRRGGCGTRPRKP